MGKRIDITNDIKRAELKQKIGDWWDRNKAMVVVFTPVIVGSVIEVAKIVTKRRNLRIEERMKDYRWYDPRLGHYWELKRKPQQHECLEIDRRQSNGERLADILSSMNLLK